MDVARELKLTLPPDLAQAVREQIDANGYVDAVEVVREGLAALVERDRDVEAWLAGPVMETYRRWQSGTLPTMSMEEVRSEFEAEHAKRR